MATKNTKKKSSKASKQTSKKDLISLILRDHKPLWKLIKTMKSEKVGVAQKREAFGEFAPALVSHAKPEEKTWYVDMKSDEDMKLEGLEGDVEHSLADQLCNELKKTNDDDLFEAKVKVLAELVEHHLEEEEEEMLPDYKKETSLEDREALGEKYEQLRAEYL